MTGGIALVERPGGPAGVGRGGDLDHRPPMPRRLDDRRVAVVEGQRDLGRASPRGASACGTARSCVPVRPADDLVAPRPGTRPTIGCRKPSGLKPNAASFFAASPTLGPSRRGQQALAVGVEQPVVVVGDHLIAAEDDHPAPLLQVVVQRGDLGLGELGDVAEHDGVVTAPGRAATSCDSETTSVRITDGDPGRRRRRGSGLGQVVGLGLERLGLEVAVDQQDVQVTRGPARPASGGCRACSGSSSIWTSTRWSPGRGERGG